MQRLNLGADDPPAVVATHGGDCGHRHPAVGRPDDSAVFGLNSGSVRFGPWMPWRA